MSKTFSGGCFCGSVRYRLLRSPLIVHCCHCTECQRQTGSAFVINAVIETQFIRKQKGALERVPMSKKNESPHDIYRCRSCKIAVWSDYGRRPYVRFVRVSTLDRRREVRPDVHIFTRFKVPWVRIPRGQKSVPVYYDINRLWPKSSLARRQKMIQEHS